MTANDQQQPQRVSQRARRQRRSQQQAAPIPPSDFLTLEEAEAFSRTPISSLRGWIARSLLPAYKPGRQVLVRRTELEAFIVASRRGKSASVAA